MTRHTPHRAALAALILAAALGACSDRTPTSPPAAKPKEKPLANVSYTTTNTTSYSSFKWHPGEACSSGCDVQINITEEVVNENNAVTYSGETGQFGATINGTTASVPSVFVSPHRNTGEKLRFTLRKAIGTGVPSSWTNCGSVTPDMPSSGNSYTVTFPANSTCPSGGSALALVDVSWTPGDYAIGSITVPAPSLRQYDQATVAVVTKASNGTQITGQTVSMTSSDPATVQVLGCTLSNCTVKALQGGTVTLTATDSYTGVQGSATVTVTARPVTRVDVTPATLTIQPGFTNTLTAKAYDAANTEITGAPAPTWASGNSSIASVLSTSGNTATVQGGTATGTTTLSATIAGITGSSSVTLVPKVTLSLDKSYAYNEYATATATPTPSGSYYYQWQYRFCSNSTLASDCNGAYYSAPSGVGVTTLSKFVYPRDYWVEFIVTLRASATGTIYDTQSIQVSGAGQSGSTGGGGGTGGGGDGGGCTTTAC